jgi:hypothetical protein
MRQVFVTIGLGLAVACCLDAARAQVVVNQQALQQLSGKPAAPPPVARPRYHPVIRHPVIRHPAPRRVVERPVIARPLPLPPPPPSPVVAAAPPPKPMQPRAVTLIFPHVDVSLPGTQAKALDAFIGLKLDTAAHFVVQATAPGVSGDPSVARRMALNRGLAVRAVLRRAGVKSDHIIVQALGDPPGLVPDHVTLTEIP